MQKPYSLQERAVHSIATIETFDEFQALPAGSQKVTS